MQELRTDVAVTQERRANLTKRWHLPQRNTNFTGRENLLDQISERLSGSKPLVISACHGLGGVGKTQLVTEFSYRNEKKYERIIWVSAESSDQIETAYLSLGQDLGIIPEKTPPAEAIHMVKTWLSNHPRNLMIFDNAENYEAIQNYVLPSGADILITSRHTVWPEKGIEVDVFSLEEAVLYFRKIVGERVGDTKEKIEELAEELGRLPLALAQACAYIRQNKISIEEYLDLYLEKKAYLLSKDVLPQGDHHATVYVTWDVTMEKIRQQSKLAPALLNICSYLHSERIPALLLEPFSVSEKFNPESKELFEEARGCLRNYSIVSVDDEDNSVSVHRLIQEVTHLKQDENDRQDYIEAISKVCLKIYPYGDQQAKLKDLYIRKSLLPHLESLNGKLTNDTDKKIIIDILDLLQEGYSQFRVSRKQLVTLERQLAIMNQGTPHYSDLSRVLTHLAIAYGDLGDTAKKIVYLRQVIKLLESNKAKQTAEFAQVLTNLGNAFLTLGYLPQSKQCYENALAIFNSTTGHCETGVVICSLANVVGDLGNIEEKISLLNTALPIIERDFGLDHPQYARVLGNLGNAFLVKGDYSEACRLQERALACKKTFYGNEHPDVARTMSNLATVYGYLGQHLKKLELLEKTLKIFEEAFSQDHLEVAKVLINLAFVRGDLKDYFAERQLLLGVERIFDAQPKPDSLEMARLIFALGTAYEQLGDLVRQDELHEKSLMIERKHLGDNDPQVAITLHSIAIVRLEQKRFIQAFDFCYRAYLICSKHADIGPQHPQTKKIQNALPKIIIDAERYLEAHQNDHALHLWLANFYLNQNNLDNSIRHYLAAVEFLEGNEAASTSHNLACLYHVRGDIDAADQYFQMALVYRTAVSTYSDYGLFLYKQGRFQDAIDNFLTVFSMTEDSSGLSYGKLELVRLDDYLQKEIQLHGDLSVKPIIMAYYWIIRCYQQLGEQAECENYLSKFREAVEISAEPLCWRLLSYTYEYLGRTNEAEECREMLSAIEFSKQMTDAEAVGQFGFFPSSPRSPCVEKSAEFLEKRECKK